MGAIASGGAQYLNEEVLQLSCEHRLVLVPGATHLFEEPGGLERVAMLAGDWFRRHLAPQPRLTRAINALHMGD
jgi:hypothetical protein